MKRLLRALGLALTAALIPASAWAYNVTSDDGDGEMFVTGYGDQSFSSSGDLRSRTGNNVYYRGIVIYNSYTDYTCDRITSNTSSATYVAKSGSCTQFTPIPPSADAAGWKVCRDRTGLPDGCGPQTRQNF
jgi:hypothetical protein